MIFSTKSYIYGAFKLEIIGHYFFKFQSFSIFVILSFR